MESPSSGGEQATAQVPAVGEYHCVHDPRLSCSLLHLWIPRAREIFINIKIEKALRRTILLSLTVNALGQPSSECLRNED